MQRCCANGIVLILNAWACHADTLRVRAVEVACTVKFYLPAALHVVVNAVVVVVAIDMDGWRWLTQVSGCGMRWHADTEGISVKKNTYYWVLVVDLYMRADLLHMRAYALRVDTA